jgi:hypothetical protein
MEQKALIEDPGAAPRRGCDSSKRRQLAPEKAPFPSLIRQGSH